MVHHTPLPSCIAPGHQTTAAKRTPSNRQLPKYPSLICHAPVASHCPVVGSALNWQGQPQLQLQLTTSSPAIRHLIFVGSLIFLCSFTLLNRFLVGFFSANGSHRREQPCPCAKATSVQTRGRRDQP